MNKPCEHCDKADCKKYKSDYFKCEKPCERAKMCKRNDEQLLKIGNCETRDARSQT